MRGSRMPNPIGCLARVIIRGRGLALLAGVGAALAAASPAWAADPAPTVIGKPTVLFSPSRQPRRRSPRAP